MRPAWGEPESGTEDLWARGAADAGAQAGAGETPARLDTELGYGLPALGGHGVFTLKGALGLSDGGVRTERLGGVLEARDGFELSLMGERSVPADREPVLGLLLGLRMAW